MISELPVCWNGTSYRYESIEEFHVKHHEAKTTIYRDLLELYPDMFERRHVTDGRMWAVLFPTKSGSHPYYKRCV